MAEGESKFKEVLAEANIKPSWKLYFVDAMGQMALALFASLLIGTILNTIGVLLPDGNAMGEYLLSISQYTSLASGAAMAGAIAYSLQAPPLVLYSILSVGVASNVLGGAAGPLLILIVAIIATEVGKFFSKKTRLDILITPAITIMVGVLLAQLFAPALTTAVDWVIHIINWSMDKQPILMGAIIAVLMGICLTLPISSAVIAVALNMAGLAGGAALAGCCAQMMGFAAMSKRDNNWGGFTAQAIGTSMLQMPNIAKNPRTWIPPILTSAITGALATSVLRIEMNGSPISSGMGTSGLVGPIGVITGWFNPSTEALAQGAQLMNPGFYDWFSLLMISIVLPIVLTLIFAAILRKLGWIRDGDLAIDS